ncbi:13492_t:CDS:1, partial [Acaulospora colombiana]
AFESLLDFDLIDNENKYAIAYPIAATEQQREGFNSANRYSYDHFYSWVNGVAYNGRLGWYIHFLLVDLTPGQIAAESGWGKPNVMRWAIELTHTKRVCLTEEEQQGVEGWNAQDVFDKLVQPIMHPNVKIRLVGILRPEGSLPNVSSSELEPKFNGVPVKWIDLTDISYGAATVIKQEGADPHLDRLGSGRLSLPTGILLANDETITVISANTFYPVQCTVLFTNSQDNQTTATVIIICGATACMELTLHDLTPKPRGESRIKVTIGTKTIEDTELTIEEFGTDNK